MAAKIAYDSIRAKGLEVGIYTTDFKNEFISLTDIARYQKIEDPRFVIRNWMRNRDTVEFLGRWETLYNPNFNRAEFDTFRSEAGKNSFVISPEKWIESTNAMGMISKRGRYGSGTFAHSDIASKKTCFRQNLQKSRLSTLTLQQK